MSSFSFITELQLMNSVFEFQKLLLLVVSLSTMTDLVSQCAGAPKAFKFV
jgi:hypothetical protein